MPSIVFKMLRLTLYVIFVSGVYETIGAPSAEHQSNDLKPDQRWVSGVKEDPIDGIVGGDEVDIKEYPYQVALLFMGRLYCGGSIINDRYVLTAAHCLRRINPDEMFVRVGSSTYLKGGKLYEVESYKIHENYNKKELDFDVGIIKIARKMELDGVTSAPTKLPVQGSCVVAGKNVVVTGWGAVGEGYPISKVLRAVTVPVVALEKCNATYEGMITNNMICAGVPEGGKDSCQGDSGGPAVAADSGMQLGIVSFGHGCAREGFPGVYTNVANVRNWIKEATGV